MPTSNKKISELTRQLNLLPYFRRYPDRSVMEAARDLGQTPQEIMEDLNRLWMCGLPGLLPGDLVELEHTYTSVKVHNAQGLDKPLRLTATEAAVLLLTLESLENFPGLGNQSAVMSAALKLRKITGDATGAVFNSTADHVAPAATKPLLIIREAMETKQQIVFNYHSFSSDSTRSRQVSPAQLFTKEGQTYLKAWDSTNNSHRIFRVDRMTHLRIIGEKSDPHLMRMKFSADDPFNTSGFPDTAEVLVREDGLWLADQIGLTVNSSAKPTEDSLGTKWYEASVPILSREWFVRFSISYIDQLTVINPADLATAIRTKVHAGLSAYNLDVE